MRPQPLLALLASAALLAVPTAGPARAADGRPSGPSGPPPSRVTFGIGPAGPAGPDTRPALRYALTPGSSVVDHVAVVSSSNQPLRLKVYTGDGLNALGGGLDLTKRADRNTGVGAWLTLGPMARSDRPSPGARSGFDVVVPPQSAARGRGLVVVPLRLTVPSDATPGDHVGGVVVSLISRGDSTRSQNVELEQRVATRVYVRVAGAVRPGLSVQVLETSYDGGSGLGLSGAVRTTYRITNTGNTRLGAKAVVTASGLAGLGSSTAGSTVEELVPGGSATVTTSVEGVPPTGLARTRVDVTGVAPPDAGADSGALPVTRATAWTWAVTWQEGVALGLLALAGLLLGYRRRRPAATRRARHARAARGRPAAPTSQTSATPSTLVHREA